LMDEQQLGDAMRKFAGLTEPEVVVVNKGMYAAFQEIAAGSSPLFNVRAHSTPDHRRAGSNPGAVAPQGPLTSLLTRSVRRALRVPRRSLATLGGHVHAFIKTNLERERLNERLADLLTTKEP